MSSAFEKNLLFYPPKPGNYRFSEYDEANQLIYKDPYMALGRHAVKVPTILALTAKAMLTPHSTAPWAMDEALHYILTRGGGYADENRVISKHGMAIINSVIYVLQEYNKLIKSTNQQRVAFFIQNDMITSASQHECEMELISMLIDRLEAIELLHAFFHKDPDEDLFCFEVLPGKGEDERTAESLFHKDFVLTTIPAVEDLSIDDVLEWIPHLKDVGLDEAMGEFLDTEDAVTEFAKHVGFEL